MKRIAYNELCLYSRIVWENQPLYCLCAPKIWKNGQKIAAEIVENTLKNLHFWDKKIFPADTEANNATAGTHTDLPVSDVDKNMQVSPFSKVPAN
jgi:hypothetical protein